jgi:hypothetical protein
MRSQASRHQKTILKLIFEAILYRWSLEAFTDHQQKGRPYPSGRLFFLSNRFIFRRTLMPIEFSYLNNCLIFLCFQIKLSALPLAALAFALLQLSHTVPNKLKSHIFGLIKLKSAY